MTTSSILAASRTILLLGGYGNAGYVIADLLLQRHQLQQQRHLILILAGRNLEKAQAMATRLNQAHQVSSCLAQRVDASDLTSIEEALTKSYNDKNKVDTVIVASSTMKFYSQVLVEALNAVPHEVKVVCDIQASTAKPAIMGLQMDQPNLFDQQNCTFITGGGFHPGLPAALMQYAQALLNDKPLTHLQIGCVISSDWRGLPVEIANDTRTEFVQELMDFDQQVYRDQIWHPVSLWAMPEKIDFGPDLGKRDCVAMNMEELHALVEDKKEQYSKLVQLGFYMAGFHWFVDMIVMPLIMMVLWCAPWSSKSMGSLLFWSLVKTQQPPYITLLQAKGRSCAVSTHEAPEQQTLQEATVNITVSHSDSYFLTAAPLVACLEQYWDGTIPLEQGKVYLQGCIVEPKRFFHDLKAMGVTVQQSTTSE
jgi:saccharopine dehydrogenase (NAD+, L-lysine-forming)